MWWKENINPLHFGLCPLYVACIYHTHKQNINKYNRKLKNKRAKVLTFFPNLLHLPFLPSSILDVCPAPVLQRPTANGEMQLPKHWPEGSILLQLEFFGRAPATSSWASCLCLVKRVFPFSLEEFCYDLLTSTLARVFCLKKENLVSGNRQASWD